MNAFIIGFMGTLGGSLALLVALILLVILLNSLD